MIDERIINRIKLTNNVIDFDMSLKGNLIIFSILIRITPNILPTLSIMDLNPEKIVHRGGDFNANLPVKKIKDFF